MDRNLASQSLRTELDKHGLGDWSIRISSDPNQSYLGLCSQKDKCIIINAHHVDLHPDDEVICTIKHEVAHAIVGCEHGHDDVWASKAREIGCDNTLPCSHLNLPEYVIDAIRSGANVELTVETETHVIRRPKFHVSRLQDKCPKCGKVAEERFSIITKDKEGNDVKLITLKCYHIIKKIIPRATPFDTLVSNSWRPEIAACPHEFIKNKCEICGENRLFNFQVIGAQSIEQALAVGKGHGIFDEMGLGKTIQALAYIKFHPEQTPTLYVVKSAIKFQWLKEIYKWLGPDYLAQIIATGKDHVFPGLKSYIIAYDLLRRFDKTKLLELGIKCVILDECQQIKNPDSTRTQEVRNILKNPEIKVIAISGTPWKNRGSEFFPVLNVMDPIKFPSYQGFLQRWVDYYWDGSHQKQGGIRDINQFKSYTSGLITRREYNEVMDEFPDINRMKLNVKLDELEQSTYDEAVSEFVAWYNNAVIGGEEDSLNGIEILAKMSKMRHITGLAKIPATLGFVEEFIDECERKLVIFVHHRDVGRLMYDALTEQSKQKNADWFTLAKSIKDANIPILKLSAEQSDVERFETAEYFNNNKRCIMIASTLASGEGINLQTCSDAIMHERQWNPQNEDQAFPGRFRRIGQLAKVLNGTYIEGEATIDEHLDYLVENKRKAFHDSMNKGEMPSWNESSIGKDLAQLIVSKHNNKNKSKVTNITSQTTFTRKQKVS